MSEGMKPQRPFDPTELWKQWYETTAKMWSNALNVDKEAFVDPYSLYQLWLRNIGDAQKHMQVNALNMMNTKEIWNQWYDATIGAWKRTAEMGGDPLGLTTQWLAMMEEMRKRIMNGNILPTDPFTFFRDWYNATSETWAKVVDDMISSEKFIESASPFLEIYANFTKTLRRANEEYFKNLQLPTRSDLARVAGLIVALEEKVDTMEDAFDDLSDISAKVATSTAIDTMEVHLNQVETKLDSLAASSTQVVTNETFGRMEGRISQVETKLDSLAASSTQVVTNETFGRMEEHLNQVEAKLDSLAANSTQVVTNETFGRMEGRISQVESKLDTLAAALERNEAANTADAEARMTKRLDEVEHKLDRLLAALEKIETRQVPESADMTGARPGSRSQKKSSKQVTVQE